MKYVLDASVALKTVLPEEDSDKAIALRDAFQENIHQLIAPDILPSEVAHALAKAERRGILKSPEGLQRLLGILSLSPDLYPSLPLLPRAYEIASAVRIGVYDCTYVALAEREHCELVTADKKLIANLQSDFPFILSLDSIRP